MAEVNKKNATETYRNCIYQFHYKAYVFAEPLKVSHGTLGLRGIQFEYQCPRVKQPISEANH
jgi:hypothetical protein